MYLLTSHVYNYLTMCKRIIDVGLNCWCCIAAMPGAISFVCRHVVSDSFGILSKYLFVNLWFNMCINEVSHCGLLGFCAFNQPNQTKLNLRTFWVFQKTSPFTKIWSNRIKNYWKKKQSKNPCPKTRIEDKTNLTFLGIKWPIEIDMPLNKTQTYPHIILCLEGL